MFAPRGYTAIPQEAVDDCEDDVEHDQLRQAVGQEEAASGEKTMELASGEEKEDGGEKDQTQRKRNRVRFDSKALELDREPLSTSRRVCFLVSLMLCTLTIFVFAFTVPCKRASCTIAVATTTTTTSSTSTEVAAKVRANWTVSFPMRSSQGGITLHETRRRGADIIVAYKTASADTGKRTIRRNSGLLSLDDGNGTLVWTYNASSVREIISCKTDNNGNESCLIVSQRGELQSVMPAANRIKWSRAIYIGSSRPSIIVDIADCDGDGNSDVLLSYDRTVSGNSSNAGQLQVISGWSGRRIGNVLAVPQSHLIERVSLHPISDTANVIFVLTVGNKGRLKVLPIRKLYQKILHPDSTDLFQSGQVLLARELSVKHSLVIKDLNQDFVDDIVLVTLNGNKHSLTAVDGGNLKKIWRITFGRSKIVSSPVIGHFNNDSVPDIMVVLRDATVSTVNQTLVQILDGENGRILWSRRLTLAPDTAPSSVKLAYKRDAFVMWIAQDEVRRAPDGNHVTLRSNTTSGNVPRSRRRRGVPPGDDKEHRSIKDVEEELDSLVQKVNMEPASVESTATTVTPTRRKKILEILESLHDKAKPRNPTTLRVTSSNAKSRTRQTTNAAPTLAPLNEQRTLPARNNNIPPKLGTKRTPTADTDGQMYDKSAKTTPSFTDDVSTGSLRLKSTNKVPGSNPPQKADVTTVTPPTPSTPAGRRAHFPTFNNTATDNLPGRKEKDVEGIKLGVTSGKAVQATVGFSNESRMIQDMRHGAESRQGIVRKDGMLRNASVAETRRSQNESSPELKPDGSTSMAGFRHNGSTQVGDYNETRRRFSGSANQPENIHNVTDDNKDEARNANKSTMHESNARSLVNGSLNATMVYSSRNNASVDHNITVTRTLPENHSSERNHSTNATVEHAHGNRTSPRQLSNATAENWPTNSSVSEEKRENPCPRVSYSLVAIFPNQQKNTFSVVATEKNTEIDRDPCKTTRPFIASNPVLRVMDDYLEIFYVVNYVKERRTTMQVKRINIRIKHGP